MQKGKTTEPILFVYLKGQDYSDELFKNQCYCDMTFFLQKFITEIEYISWAFFKDIEH